VIGQLRNRMQSQARGILCLCFFKSGVECHSVALSALNPSLILKESLVHGCISKIKSGIHA
jgi:hypothetical protein